MKLTVASAFLVLLATINASAKTFTHDCDEMRDIGISLQANLLKTDKNVMDFLSELTKKGTNPDFKPYIDNSNEIAKTIDRLNALINQNCN